MNEVEFGHFVKVKRTGRKARDQDVRLLMKRCACNAVKVTLLVEEVPDDTRFKMMGGSKSARWHNFSDINQDVIDTENFFFQKR